MSYAKARKDFEYLETLAELRDWIEIQGDALDLMQCPTKANAESFYCRCIDLWFIEALRDGRELTKRAESIGRTYYAL